MNLSALSVFALSWLSRDLETLAPGIVTLLLEVTAAGLVTWGGWMGGILVYRNQIGVDHRYAEAGKWQEQTIPVRTGEPIAVALTDDLKVDQMKLLRLEDGRRLVLARTEAGFVAFDDHCPHKGGSLAGGLMACGTVICPWHGSEFDVSTAAKKAGPTEKGISTYRVEQDDGTVNLIL